MPRLLFPGAAGTPAALLPLVLLLVPHPSAAARSGQPPHIVMHLMDDWGRYDVGFRGNAEAVTPNMDALATSGVVFDRSYTHKYCSPSRSALQSGRDPVHVNVFNLDYPIYNLSDPVSGFPGIPRNMTTVAEILKAQGYATAASGKWDCGSNTPDHIPAGRGYDTSLVYLGHLNEYWTNAAQVQCSPATEYPQNMVDLWDGDKPAWGLNNSQSCSQANQAPGCVYEDELFAQRVLDTINAHDPTTPLYIFWAPHTVHGPLEAPQAYIDKFSAINDTSRRLYMSMVNFIDDKVGEVVAALKAKGMWDNLLWVTSSDNGGPINGGANNFPLKGGKFSNWEGGIRVTAFASGGALPEAVRGTTYDGLLTLPDMYATFAAVAGAEGIYDSKAAAAGLPQPDALNMWPAISGANLTSPRARYFIGSSSNTTGGGEGPAAALENVTVQGVIELPYKLLIGPSTMNVWTGPVFPNTTGPAPSFNEPYDCQDPFGTMFALGTGCLFNIVEDEGEHVNLAGDPAYKNITLRLRREIEAYQALVFNPRRGTQNFTRACGAAFGDAPVDGFGPYRGFVGPFLA
jgi:arylsulfatase B